MQPPAKTLRLSSSRNDSLPWSRWTLYDESEYAKTSENANQREAIVQFVGKESDVFVNLPTGYGKSYGGTRIEKGNQSKSLRTIFFGASTSIGHRIEACHTLCASFTPRVRLQYSFAHMISITQWMDADWLIQYNWRTEGEESLRDERTAPVQEAGVGVNPRPPLHSLPSRRFRSLLDVTVERPETPAWEAIHSSPSWQCTMGNM